MAKISRGRLNTPIGIVRKITTRTKTGAVKVTDSVMVQTWCELLPISTRDFVAGHAAGSSIDAKMHVDMATDIKASDELQVLDGSGFVYEVLGIMPVARDNKKIVVCRTKINS
ncbi:head-tail adaptor protein [Psychrobacter glaciei]|uniref:phage head completion protein n=1 Tax=Psychrobacter glaciei TaxID=619771 RepID=UPI001F061808|nr:head-tail adaptor protein [Psychrobacter glaciei]MCH1781740.1 head-tail adaptor protein [Psychrobacter glaciei]